MRDEIIKRSLVITVISLIIFFIVSLYITSYYNRKSLEENLINISEVMNRQIKETTTEEEIVKIVNYYSANQNWIRIVLANSIGNIIIDSTTDSSFSIHDEMLTKDELALANSNSSSYQRVYVEDDATFYIEKISDDIIVRTSITITTNENYILSSIFYMLLLILGVLIFGILYTRKTSNLIVEAFASVRFHLKTINEGEYLQIDTNHRYPEVMESLEEINEINKNIYQYILNIKNERDKINFIVNNMQQGIIIIDEYETLLIINDYALNSLKIDIKQDYDLNFKEVLKNEFIVKKILLSLRNKQNQWFDYHDEQSHKIYAFTLNFLENKWNDTFNSVGLLFVSIIEVTETRRNDEIRAEFIANASHELKTPITSISGFSELVLNNLGDCDDKTKNYISKIYQSSLRMKTMIDELLYLSNLDYKSDSIPMTGLVRLDTIILEIVESYHEFSRKNNVTIETLLIEASILCSKPLIEHLISNLIENAIKYNKPKGKVTVSLEETHNKVILKVIDTGVGIDVKYLNKIYDRFYRVDGSRNRSTGGTGLGLTISKKICTVHGATIDVSSELNIGSTFTVTFNKNID